MQGFAKISGAEEGQQRPFGVCDGGSAGACRGQHAHQECEQDAACQACRAAQALSAGGRFLQHSALQETAQSAYCG